MSIKGGAFRVLPLSEKEKREKICRERTRKMTTPIAPTVVE
jgi:hypothetical protein